MSAPPNNCCALMLSSANHAEVSAAKAGSSAKMSAARSAVVRPCAQVCTLIAPALTTIPHTAKAAAKHGVHSTCVSTNGKQSVASTAVVIICAATMVVVTVVVENF